MRGPLVTVGVVAVVVAGCASAPADQAEPGAKQAPPRSPAAVAVTGTASGARAKPVRPELPRLEGEVLAVTRGRTTTIMTLGGRELARLRGYSASTSTRPVLQRGLRMWTLRGGRPVPVREQWNVPVRGHGDACTVLGRLAGASLLSCVGTPRPKPLLVRPRGAPARPLVPSLDADGSGHWRTAFVSPDRRRLLLTWSTECEVPTALFAPARGGRAVPVTGHRDWTKAPESVALGWTKDGRALVHLLGGACGNGARRPGVYAFGPRGARLVAGPAVSAAFFPG